MKKFKLVSFLALLLTAAMLLVSCGSGGTEIKSLLDKDATAQTSTYGAIEKVSGLTDVSRSGSKGDLYYFTSSVTVGTDAYTKHIVYNAATDKVVWEQTDSETVKNRPVLVSEYDENSGKSFPAFFIVQKTYYETLSDNAYPTVSGGKVSLHSLTGTEVASETLTKQEASASGTRYAVKMDLVLFNDVLYRTTEGGLERVTEVSPFAGLPALSDLTAYMGDYYYACDEGEGVVKVYDAELAFVSSYKLPTYAEEKSFHILKNGDILAQYVYEEDSLSDKYSFIDEGTKYQFVTELISAKNGSAKQIQYEYVLDYVSVLTDELAGRSGIKEGSAPHLAVGTKIENRRMGEQAMLILDDKGNAKELAEFNGDRLQQILLLADGRWAIVAGEHAYLVNEKGEILGDIVAGTPYESFINCDGKLYDYDLNVLYDYDAANKDWYSGIGDGAIFREYDESENAYSYYLFTGSSDLKKIVDAEDEDVTFYDVTADYYVLKKRTVDMYEVATYKYVYYNLQGESVLTLTSATSSGNTLSMVGSGESYALYTAKNADGDTVVYRIAITH